MNEEYKKLKENLDKGNYKPILDLASKVGYSEYDGHQEYFNDVYNLQRNWRTACHNDGNPLSLLREFFNKHFPGFFKCMDMEYKGFDDAVEKLEIPITDNMGFDDWWNLYYDFEEKYALVGVPTFSEIHHVLTKEGPKPYPNSCIVIGKLKPWAGDRNFIYADRFYIDPLGENRLDGNDSSLWDNFAELFSRRDKRTKKLEDKKLDEEQRKFIEMCNKTIKKLQKAQEEFWMIHLAYSFGSATECRIDAEHTLNYLISANVGEEYPYFPLNQHLVECLRRLADKFDETDDKTEKVKKRLGGLVLSE